MSRKTGALTLRQIFFFPVVCFVFMLAGLVGALVTEAKLDLLFSGLFTLALVLMLWRVIAVRRTD